MATLNITQIPAYWATQSGLNALIPSSSVWLDVPADGASLPYAILTQVSDIPQWNVAGNYLARFRLRITVYAATLAAQDTIAAQIYAAFDNITGMYGAQVGSIRTNVIPRGLHQGAYQCIFEYILFQDLVRP